MPKSMLLALNSSPVVVSGFRCAWIYAREPSSQAELVRPITGRETGSLCAIDPGVESAGHHRRTWDRVLLIKRLSAGARARSHQALGN